jgi:mono/diheme cytochrome c family protein
MDPGFTRRPHTPPSGRAVLAVLAVAAYVLAASGGVFGASARQVPVARAAAASHHPEQARRGRTVFDRACRQCHTVEATTAPANVGDPIPLVGVSFTAKWRTVGDLFSKTRSTMPANAVGGLSIGDTLDVVAFMLQANGVRAGRTFLSAELNALHLLVLHAANDDTPPNDLRTGRFYSDAQALRGEVYFRGHCATCHSTSAGEPTHADLASGHRGALLGNGYRHLPIATGASRWERYPDVFALFNKIQRSMPAHDPGALSLGTYLDLTAYVLKINGAPAGAEELVFSEHAMKSMMLNEPGFERLFNGKDFAGIKLVVGPNCRVSEARCQQQETGRPFKVADGLIAATGAGQGYWYADARYLNFTLRFDFRFVVPKDMQEERDFIGNSGYMLFVTEHQVWPRMLQIEGGLTNMLSPAPLGGRATFSVDDDARRRALRPLNEWNAVEIVSSGGRVTARLNNTLVATVTSHEFTEPGYIGFQAEAGEIHWRNIRIRPE